MKTLRLYAATLLAIKEHAEDGEPFSARDIKEYIDGKLEDGEWELVSGHPLVKHDTIRQYVHEIMDNKLLELTDGNYTFEKDYPVNSLGDSYKRYSVVFDNVPDWSDPDYEEVFEDEDDENFGVQDGPVGGGDDAFDAFQELSDYEDPTESENGCCGKADGCCESKDEPTKSVHVVVQGSRVTVTID